VRGSQTRRLDLLQAPEAQIVGEHYATTTLYLGPLKWHY
jgi:hypothetical protein